MESFYEKQAFDLVSKAIESALRAVELEKRHNLVCINCPTKNKVSFEGCYSTACNSVADVFV